VKRKCEGKPEFLYFGCGDFRLNVLRLTVLYRVVLTSSVPGVWGEGGPICIALLLFSL
jgi:hypothetical protein